MCDTGGLVGVRILADHKVSSRDVTDEVLNEEASDLVRVRRCTEEAGVVHRVGVIRRVGEDWPEAESLATRNVMGVMSQHAGETSGGETSDEQTTHGEEKAGIRGGEGSGGWRLPDGEGGEMVDGRKGAHCVCRTLIYPAPRDADNPNEVRQTPK